MVLFLYPYLQKCKNSTLFQDIMLFSLCFTFSKITITSQKPDQNNTLHNKPYFLFRNTLKRLPFQKKCIWIWSFLYHQERWYFFSLKIWYFFSLKIWSYSLERKWKIIFFKKFMEIWYFRKRWSFQKNCTEIWSFLYDQERCHLFLSKIWYFFYCRKWKMVFLKKKHGNVMFSIYSVKMILLFLTNIKLPFCQKSKGDLLLEDTPKDVISVINEKDDTYPIKDDIGILGWHHI